MEYNGIKLPEFPRVGECKVGRREIYGIRGGHMEDVPYAMIYHYNDVVLPPLPHERGAV